MTNQPPAAGQALPKTGPLKQRITPRALLEVKRIGDPQIHPDGLRVAFVVEEADFDSSRWTSHLWLAEWVEPEAEEKPEERLEASEPGVSHTSEDASSTPPILEDEDYARQLTYSYEGEAEPLWSPDGEMLAFLSARPDPAADEDDEDDGTIQVWILPADGGEARKITSAREGILGYEWASDSGSLFYMTSESHPKPTESLRKEQRRKYIDPIVEIDDKFRKQIWHIGVDDKKPHLLLNGDYGLDDFAVSPDGNSLCFTTNYSGDPDEYHIGDLYLHRLDNGATTKLVERLGGKYSLKWSRDGAKIAFQSGLDPDLSYSRTSLFVVDVPVNEISESDSELESTSELTPLFSPTTLSLTPTETYGLSVSGATECRLYTDLDFDIGRFDWRPGEAGGIYALALTGASTQLYHLTSRGSEPIFEGRRERSGLTVALEEDAYAYIEESETVLPELFLRDSKGATHQITHLNAEFSKTYNLPRQEVVTWKSDDGLEIEGILAYPAEYESGVRYPFIVQVHGGPNARTANTLRDYYHHPVWAAEGYLVLRPNFRGSEGYGNAFSVANRRDLGGGDYRDIMAGVDWAISQGLADPARIGIMGGSYGGYMTNWAISQTDRFKAAISMFGIFNLQTDFSNSVSSRWELDYLGDAYWNDPEVYARLSPGSYARNIKTPTLIIHGDEDDNTFISNSKEMFRALKLMGVKTNFVHYPREGHGVREPNHKLDEVRRCLAWMDRYLLHSGDAQQTYRLGDRVKHADGAQELTVSKVDAPHFLGRALSPERAKLETESLLEITLTLTGMGADERLISLSEVRLELTPEGSIFLPTGVPVDVPGGKLLVEGENLRSQQRPDPHTGQSAFALSLVYRIPKNLCEGKLHLPGFAPVSLIWNADPKEDEEDSTPREPEIKPHD